MSCLEEGTKNINLTLPYAINKPIVKSYCGSLSDFSLIFTSTYPTTNMYDGTSLPYFKEGGTYSLGNCSAVTSVDPYFILQMDNDSLSGQGWAICGGSLSYPNNLLVYKEDGTLVAGGSEAGIITVVVNLNPVQLMVRLTSLADPDLTNGYVIYQNDGVGEENPPIASSPRLYFKVVT